MILCEVILSINTIKPLPKDFKDKGGFNSDSYSFLSQDDDTDKLPGPVKLIPSEWSKPEGAEYGKNKDGNFMIVFQFKKNSMKQPFIKVILKSGYLS